METAHKPDNTPSISVRESLAPALKSLRDFKSLRGQEQPFLSGTSAITGPQRGQQQPATSGNTETEAAPSRITLNSMATQLEIHMFGLSLLRM
uniref:Uncharacterized protein n=1 Tax=Glossina pallidipes TaxID=7398 RepID=A0A1A9ZW20_GLOPL